MLAAVGWTLAIGVIAAALHQLSERQLEEVVVAEAGARLSQDLTYRRWASRHGGVYVPVTDSTPPNPYLEGRVAERDLVTGSGRHLTLVNPAYMTRQVHELSLSVGGSRAHITSLHPIRPENAPDAWERRALQAFERGESRMTEHTTINGEPHLRLMIALRTEKDCLGCHVTEREGDLRGGLSVAVSMTPFVAAERTRKLATNGFLAGVWLLGLVGLGVGGRRTARQFRQLKRAESTLSTSNLLLQEAQSIGLMGSYVLDIPTSKWTCSPVMREIFGLAPQHDYDIAVWADLVHPSDRERVFGHIFGAWENTPPHTPGRHVDVEYRIVRASDGAVRWVHGFGAISWDSSGRPIRMGGTIQEVTQRRAVEDAIRLNARRLRGQVAVLEESRAGSDAVLRRLVDVAADLTGSTQGELHLQGDSAEVQLHPVTAGETEAWPEADGLPALLQRTLLERAAIGGALPACDALERHYLLTPIVAGDRVLAALCLGRVGEPYTAEEAAQVSLLLGTAWQAVERARAEARRAESESRFERLVQSVPDVVYRLQLRPQPRFDFISPSLEEMVGRTPAELYGEPGLLERMVHAEDRLLLARHLRSREPLLVRWHRRDGELVWVEHRHVVLRRGGALVVEGVARDVTERVRAEERRSRLEAELSQARKLETVGQLAGGLAHDFNNMLTIILGHADLLLDALPPESGARADVQAIRDAGHSSSELTRQLLKFARRETIDPKPFDLNDVVGRGLSMLRRIVREEIRIDWLPQAADARVILDPVQFQQVVANLVTNARDAIPHAGTIRIGTRNVLVDQAFCASREGLKPGSYVELSVSDDGAGMPPETRERIFEPFYTTKAAGKGTGLGLATVHGVVRQNDGWIEVESEPGRGSTFRTLFPVRHGPAEAEPPGAGAQLTSGKGTLLVVDDEQGILRLLDKTFGRAGFEVLTASGPDEAEALMALHHGRIRMLVTDVVLPGIDGKQLSERLLRYAPDLPVVFISGYAESILTRKGVLEPGTRLVTKPFTPAEILLAVNEVLAAQPA